MFHTLKRALLPVALLAVILGAGAALPVPSAEADLDPVRVWFLAEYGDTGDTTCAAGVDEDLAIVPAGGNAQELSSTAEDGDMVEIPSSGVLMCFRPQEGEGNVNIVSAEVTPDADPSGDWQTPVCGNLDRDTNLCVGTTISVGSVAIPDAGNDLALVAVFFDCNADVPVTIRVTQDTTTLEFTVYCGPPANVALIVTPSTVIESSPAIGNTAHALIRAEITTSSGGPVLPFTEVTISVSRCALSGGITDQETRDTAVRLFTNQPISADVELHEFANSFTVVGTSLTLDAFDVDTNDDDVPDHSEVLAILHAEGCTPGAVTISLSLEVLATGAEIERTATISVVGPVANITITASPTTLVCGEKSEITITATDSAGQAVSEHTFIEVVTNFGGVLAGTGSTLIQPGQPVDPISSTKAEIVNGRARAFLLTSTRHVGAYEVLAASTVSTLGTGDIRPAAPAVAQVTVTCTRAVSPTVTAPSTGTGTIRPPSTGDGGLADTGGASLLVIGAAGVLALGTFARMRRTHG
jgi:hypothetical protein